MRKSILSGVIAAVLFVALLNLPVFAQGISNFSSIVLSGDLTVGDDATIGDALTAADVTVSDDATVTDDLTTADFLLSKQTTLLVTSGGTLTVTGGYQPISSTAAVGTSSIVAPTAGRLVVLVNVGSQTITFTDTGTLKLSGNAALGAGDTLTLLGDGTNWNQLSKADN